MKVRKNLDNIYLIDAAYVVAPSTEKAIEIYTQIRGNISIESVKKVNSVLNSVYTANMELSNEINIGDIVEFIDKTPGKFPHTGKYIVTRKCSMKDPTTREWVDAVEYRDTVGKTYVRALDSFLETMKVQGT